MADFWRDTRTREERADLYAYQIIQIADDCEPEAAAVIKAKTQIDACKWLASTQERRRPLGCERKSNREDRNARPCRYF